MPLIKSKSKKAIGENIKIEREHGKPEKQAVAIALNTARESGAHIPKKKRKVKRHSHSKTHVDDVLREQKKSGRG